MAWKFVATASCLLTAPQVLPASLPHTLELAVDLGYGVYRGVHNDTTRLNVWKGIRFAAPPTGNLRWRAPIAPAVSRSGTVNATEFAAECAQALPRPLNLVSSSSKSEDCLFLNVYAPKVEQTAKLPVLVWIHGGGYGSGNGQQDMSEIVNANDNSFIAVSIQYRKLGAFGFLSSAEVQESGDLNVGILDMAFALQWVHDHIGQFGGDASRVTITGESAGAGGVMLLSIAKNGTLGSSLFSGLIAASPYLPPQYSFDASVPTQRYRSFVARAGCADAPDTLSCLRGQDFSTLQTANSDENQAGVYGVWSFLPVTEPGTGFITTLPSTSLSAHRVNGAHALVGNNANEGVPFVPQTINSTTALRTWLQTIYPALTPRDIATILTAYPAGSNTPTTRFATTGLDPPTALDVSQFAIGTQQRAYNMYAEATFVCPSYWLSSAFSNHDRTARHYQYSVPGALHTADISAYFGPATLSQPPQFTSVFRKIWGGFVNAAEPQGLGGLGWPVWTDSQTRRMLNLNTTGGVPFESMQLVGGNITEFMEPGVQNDLSIVDAFEWEGGRGKRCEMWRRVAEKVSI
ncbi:hypothetical protein AA0117_g13280 [Alternaria alternata]|uniref:Carboxylic ester hydrolase n=1 Tax=Alternaria alternata TaxID=5599 RepID=A0A4Q4MQN5_ALTAL|nr:hypothetical protein AA0117_g13280 [Alternaria alternata]